jgi:hypothetical protein
VIAAALAACRDDAPAKPPPAPPPPGKLELIESAIAGNVTPLVAAERARAERDHVHLLVYVGASWCEPCERFHQAAADGRLDAVFPDLRLVVFDADRDDDALAAAGYGSQLIPLFSEAKPDGSAGARRIEGGIKGDGAVDNLTVRLHDLLSPPR